MNTSLDPKIGGRSGMVMVLSATFATSLKMNHGAGYDIWDLVGDDLWLCEFLAGQTRKPAFVWFTQTLFQVPSERKWLGFLPRRPFRFGSFVILAVRLATKFAAKMAKKIANN